MMRTCTDNLNAELLTCGLVILNYKDYTLTEGLLSNIKDFPEIDYIAVVDNDSPNDSYDRLKKYENDKISVLQSGRNGGYSFGNNVGVRYLIENYHPDIIGIANPDTEFDGELVKKIKEVFAANPDYAVLSGFQIKPSGENGGHPFWDGIDTLYVLKCTIRNALVKPLTLLFDKLMHIPNYAAYVENVRISNNIPHQVQMVEGSLFFIRTDDFKAIGLFDENVFMYCEEDILSFKIYRWLHKKVGVVNSVNYIHAHKSPESFKRNVLTTKMRVTSQIYYFNHYLTRSRVLQVIHSLFAYLEILKLFVVYPIKKLLRISIKLLSKEVLHSLEH